MHQDQDIRAIKLIHKWDRAKEKRRPYESHWRDADRLVLLEDGFRGDSTYAPKRNSSSTVANDTAPNAADTLTSALSSFLTNATMRWFGFSARLPGDRELTQRSQQWLYDSATACLNYLASPTSRFGLASDELYGQLVGYGVGAVLMRQGNGPLTFQCRDLNSLWIMEDSEGNVNEVFYKTMMTVEEAGSRFGVENLPQKMQDAFSPHATRDSDKLLMEEVEFIQVILKRMQRNPNKLDSLNMPWASFWVACKEKHIVREGGFKKNPYLTPRWKKRPQDPYGKGPGYKAMPGIKTVNTMDDDILTAAELQIAPPMIIPSTMKGLIRMRPRGLNYHMGTHQNRPEPLFTGGDVGIGENLLERREERIKEAYMVDVLKVPMADRMTAAEFFGRRNDGLQLLNPVIERLTLEWLNPVVAATFEYLSSIGVITDPPHELLDADVSIEYTSPMALARKSSEANSMAAFFESAAVPMSMDPQAVINLDADETIRILAKSHNVNPRMLRREDEVAALREQLAQVQAVQDQLSQTEVGAGAVKDLGSGLKSLRGGP